MQLVHDSSRIAPHFGLIRVGLLPASVLGAESPLLVSGGAVRAENLIPQGVTHVPRVVLQVIKLLRVVSGEVEATLVTESKRLIKVSWACERQVGNSR